jgi:prepilin-type processing-associated H-X9-DG protein
MQTTQAAGITDGTSNTILAGEVLPAEDANNNFYTFLGGTAGTTIPPNWHTAGTSCGVTFGSTDWTCRFSYAARGFKSKHPGGLNMLFCDGSVHFVKNSISRVVYAGLGSKNGCEVLSGDGY